MFILVKLILGFLASLVRCFLSFSLTYKDNILQDPNWLQDPSDFSEFVLKSVVTVMFIFNRHCEMTEMTAIILFFNSFRQLVIMQRISFFFPIFF